MVLFDQRAHGLSEGEYSSAGLYESFDLPLFERFINGYYGTSMGVVGGSMGGAATILGLNRVNPDFLILEMVYPTMDEAITNRLRKRLGPLTSMVKYGMYAILNRRYKMDPSVVNPIESVDTYTKPVLVFAGEHDSRTTVSETQRLYDTFPEGRKQLQIFRGAAHEDLYRFDEKLYRECVKSFLKNEALQSAEPLSLVEE